MSSVAVCQQLRPVGCVGCVPEKTDQVHDAVANVAVCQQLRPVGCVGWVPVTIQVHNAVSSIASCQHERLVGASGGFVHWENDEKLIKNEVNNKSNNFCIV